MSLELPPSPAPPPQLVSYPRSTWLRKGSRPRGAPTFGSQRAPGRAPPANVRSKCTQAAPPSWTGWMPECHYPHRVVISPFLALQGPVRFPLPWTRKGETERRVKSSRLDGVKKDRHTLAKVDEPAKPANGIRSVPGLSHSNRVASGLHLQGHNATLFYPPSQSKRLAINEAAPVSRILQRMLDALRRRVTALPRHSKHQDSVLRFSICVHAPRVFRLAGPHRALHRVVTYRSNALHSQGGAWMSWSLFNLDWSRFDACGGRRISKAGFSPLPSEASGTIPGSTVEMTSKDHGTARSLA